MPRAGEGAGGGPARFRHGWIPVSASVADVQHTAERIRAAKAAGKINERWSNWESSAGGRHTKVDGVEFVEYDKVEDDPAFRNEKPGLYGPPAALTEAQKHEVAATVKGLADAFPGAPMPVIAAIDDPEFGGLTEPDGHRITISTSLWRPNHVADSQKSWGRHGTVASDFDDPVQMRRAILTHEWGHVLADLTDTGRKTAQDFTEGSVLPTDVGETPENNDILARRPFMANLPGPRTFLDHLRDDQGVSQTEYGMTDPQEWWAEAFSEGYLRGRTRTGREALAAISPIYGRKP